MGNVEADTQNCKQRVSDIIDQSKLQIQRLNPFCTHNDQLPYAEPLQINIFKGTAQDQHMLNAIIEAEPIRKPQKFFDNEGYEYDEKFWKKQVPNAVIQGHWFRRVPHGLSKFYFPGGRRVFVSYFDHGVPLFEDCLIVFENGAYYHGGLNKLKFHGFGKYVNEDESLVLEGEWKDGVPLGKGKQILVSGELLTEFEGEFGKQGQKYGQNCTYAVKDKHNLTEVLFEYKGGFENGEFVGNSTIKTNNGKYEMKSIFKGDKVTVQSLQTGDFRFEGEFEKDLSNGNCRINESKNSKIVYEGDLLKGKLNGVGSITSEDGSVQKVHWCEGLKLKHLRNFQNSINLNQIIGRIEEAYQRAGTYSEMTKLLADHYKQLHSVQGIEGVSPKGQHESYLFEMISKEKANSIVGSSKVGASILSKHPKKELIIELERGRFLYVTCFKMHPGEKVE